MAMSALNQPVWLAYRKCPTCKAASGTACTASEPHELRSLRTVTYTGSQPQNPRLALAYSRETARLSQAGR